MLFSQSKEMDSLSAMAQIRQILIIKNLKKYTSITSIYAKVRILYISDQLTISMIVYVSLSDINIQVQKMMLKKLLARFGSIRTFTQLQVLNQYLKLNKYPYLMVYFTAQWNPACSIAKQHVQLVNQTFNKIQIVQIDSDVAPKITKHYNVRAQPEFVLCLNGDELIRQTGPNKDGLLQKCRKMVEIPEQSLTPDKWVPYGTNFQQFYKHTSKQKGSSK